MIYSSYCYTDTNTFISPFYIVSIEINNSYRSNISNLIKPYYNKIEFIKQTDYLNIIKLINNYRKENKNSIYITFYKIGNYELEKYTLEENIIKGFRQGYYYNYNKLIIVSTNILNIESTKQYIFTKDWLGYVELVLGYIYSKALRNFSCRPKKVEVSKLNYLPYNYIKNNLVYKGLKDYKRYPHWLNKYVGKNYDKFIK